MIGVVSGLLALAITLALWRSRWRENMLAHDCGEDGCIYCDPASIRDAFGPRTFVRVLRARERRALQSADRIPVKRGWG